jgi:cobalt/nickel transport system permease protein
MTLALDYSAALSPLARFDPRWKLASLAPATLLVSLLRTLPACAAAFAGALLLALLARLPFRWFLIRLGSVTLFLALFLLWLPFLREGPTWDVGPLSFSQKGTLLALTLWLKALSMVSLVLVLCASAPVGVTLKAAQALHVPGLLIHLVLLTYRYVHLLADELARLRVALRIRGYRPRGNWHSYRTVGQVAGVLLVRGYERAERVSQAMRCRGFDGHFRSLVEFHTRWHDLAGFLGILASAVALLAWDMLSR